MAQNCCGPMFWTYILIIVGLVLFAGMMSGLTLGLMSLSLVDLEVLIKSGTPKDQKYAGDFHSLSIQNPIINERILHFTIRNLIAFIY
jgi:hypothetical protein